MSPVESVEDEMCLTPIPEEKCVFWGNMIDQKLKVALLKVGGLGPVMLLGAWSQMEGGH